MKKTNKAFNNGNADAVFNKPCDTTAYKTWHEQTSYLSGYLTGMTLRSPKEKITDSE